MDNYEAIQNPPLDEVLLHYGILGMRWGVRRYQNPDGSLTPEGLERQRKKQERSEIFEAKRRERKEKRALKKEEKKKKALENYKRRILRDPDKLYKHMEEFSYEEVEKALKFYEQKGRLNEARRNKMGQAKNYVDTALRYGDTVNNIIKFLNSDAGRGLRGKLGLGTEKWLDFYQQDERKSREFKREQDYLDELSKRRLNNKDEQKEKEKEKEKNKNQPINININMQDYLDEEERRRRRNNQ